MSKTTSITASVAPKSAGEDLSKLGFEELQKRFEASGCEKDSFSLATAMYANNFHKAMKLLPLNFDVYSQGSNDVAKIDAKRLDFNGKDETTSHEWASALVAAKKLKLVAGVVLEVEKIDQVVEQAQKIYLQTRKEEPLCRPM